ncbi:MULTISPECIES: hypothetical protein [Acidobacteriaceae]|uniref:hypothetical protein n=1 Tax=Acidobacteriaceae TaxID=204434 RepID=UPI00131CCC7F|nr:MULTISPECIES: hypothetical protein [Acidobacteriaceae]MDW5267956.1 hypothetical protein [Edaphobacter sp.]
MPTPLCRHVRTNGTRCGSPSLSGDQWCYFHHRLHQRHRKFRYTDATRGYLIPGTHLELLALEDSESIQLALSMVINALATSSLDTKRASTLLYGLQLASANAARLQSRPKPTDVVRDFATSPDGLDFAVTDYSSPDENNTEQEHPSRKALGRGSV